MKKTIVYVTGCLGFIGAYVTKACLQRGWYVIGVDKITYAARIENLKEFEKYGKFFKFIQSDINDLTDLYECDYVINTAAETHVDNSIENNNAFIHSNINGVHNLLELIKKKYSRAVLVHFSTDECYGDTKEKEKHKEDAPLNPGNPYSATKSAADMLIKAWWRTFKVPYIIVRPSNNYGIGQYVEKLIPKTCKCIQMARPIPLHNDGDPKRIWLHAADTADAIITIIEYHSKSHVNSIPISEIYNISGNEEYENWKIVAKIANIFGIKNETPITFLDDPNVIHSVATSKDGIIAKNIDHEGEFFEKLTKPSFISNMGNLIDRTYSRDGQDMRYNIDDTKLRDIGWKVKRSLDKELPNIVEYYQNNFIW